MAKKVWHLVRNFLFSKANKELLIFLFFLVLAGIFWLNLTLSETYEKEFAIPVSVVGIPKNAVLTSDETDTVKMTIRDKGLTLLTYLYGDPIKKININFRTYSKNNGTGSVSAQDLQKMVYQQLASGSRITSVKPERLEFFYNYGAKKRVPVRWSGRVIPEELFFITRVEYSPDSVTIYASDEKLDSINMVYTEQLNYVNFRDTLIANCELNKMKGVKMVPEYISATFYPDMLTEKVVQVPIVSVNMPDGLVLRTFPTRVNVKVVAGRSRIDAIRAENFSVVVDYADVATHPSEKCKLILRTVPKGVASASLEMQQVDYLIESLR